MTPQELQNQISELKAEIQTLKSSATFPKEISDAIAERLSDMNFTIATANLQRTIALSGNAENITVLDYPDGFRVFRVGGKNYYIPYYLNQ